jgi:DNA-directed RNA polymerase subunit F
MPMDGMDFYNNPELKKAYQMGFNDGLQCAVDNAQEFEYIDEEQAEELLTELVEIEVN